jgi:hypothetical protein
MTDPIALWWDGQREFCANPACLLHVRADSGTVRGAGQWATIDGVVYDRHSIEVGGPLYCMVCRRRLTATLDESARPAMTAAVGQGAA